MQIIEKEVVDGKTLVLDDKHLVGCKYTNCNILYSGADFALTDSSLVNCQITLSGAAQKTAAFLAMFGFGPPKDGGTPPSGGKFGFSKNPGPVQ